VNLNKNEFKINVDKITLVNILIIAMKKPSRKWEGLSLYKKLGL